MQEKIYTFRNNDDKITDIDPTSTSSQACSRNRQVNNTQDVAQEHSQMNCPQEHQQEEQQRHKSDHQIMLEFKIGQLQKICQTLTSANSRLLNRIDMLQTKLQQQQHQKQQESQHSVLHRQRRLSQNSNHSDFKTQISELENMVKQYRGNLQEGKSKFDQEMFKKQVENQRLKEQNEKLRAHIIQLKKRNQQLQRQLDAQRVNETVRTSLLQHKTNEAYYSLNTDKVALNRKLSRQRSFDSIGNRLEFETSQMQQSFNLNVFTEMERMINKLTNQLEHQRRMKKKMKLEIDRLVSQLLKSQIQIKQKNNKIYNLQLETLKQRHPSYSTFFKRQSLRVEGTRQKQYSETQHMRSSANKPRTVNLFHSVGQKQLNYRQTSTKLKDLINKEYPIEWSKKMFIAIKIIDLYDKKLAEKQFNQISIENIVIKNLNSPDHSKISIIQLSNDDQSNSLKSQENLMMNLCAIIESLLTQVKQTNQNDHQIQKEQLLQYLQYILDFKNEKLANSLSLLRKYFEQLYKKSYF